MKFFLLIPLFFLSSCVVNPPKDPRTNLTFAQAKSRLQKGMTTQDEVIKALGSPNIVNKNRKGLEVWTYSRQSTKSRASSTGFYFIFGGSSDALSTSSASTFDLVIIFNQKGLVKDYSVTTSQF